IIREAVKRGIPVISEIEWAGYFIEESCIIGITGTNGKTTTTMLTHYMLEQAGMASALTGNVGHSLARAVAGGTHSHYVVELSSFQLDGIKDFKCHISILLNITPDHLDRYKNMEAYIKSKFRVILNQTEDDHFIYNYDDEIIREELKKHPVRARLFPISLLEEVFPGAYVKEDHMYIGINEKNEFVMNMEEASLQGKHNRYNSMAAGVSSRILEVRKDVIRESLRSFQHVEHRLEHVATIKDVDFINDSKATNLNSAWYALESMTRPTVWIAGGVDKGNDYTVLKPLVRERVKTLICLGTDNEKLKAAFAKDIPTIVETQSMQEAVALAFANSQPGYAVLLAPGCASFDLFRNYEDRGKQFKHWVKNL
ncbi:MAG: UDP-N-acetylmuramoyl-L-alanine--D-glutamate ligase, partial [Bacteroidota bacterium]|nr:UDP-N-acetylmuramoyl-L-alanine--D-glutamate ligase [Bacteroidota bacterium]